MGEPNTLPAYWLLRGSKPPRSCAAMTPKPRAGNRAIDASPPPRRPVNKADSVLVAALALCRFGRSVGLHGSATRDSGHGVRLTRSSVPAVAAWRSFEAILEQFEGTTIVPVRRGAEVVLGGDGQFSLGNTILKGEHLADIACDQDLSRYILWAPSAPAPRP